MGTYRVRQQSVRSEESLEESNKIVSNKRHQCIVSSRMWCHEHTILIDDRCIITFLKIVLFNVADFAW